MHHHTYVARIPEPDLNISPGLRYITTTKIDAYVISVTRSDVISQLNTFVRQTHSARPSNVKRVHALADVGQSFGTFKRPFL